MLNLNSKGWIIQRSKHGGRWAWAWRSHQSLPWSLDNSWWAAFLPPPLHMLWEPIICIGMSPMWSQNFNFEFKLKWELTTFTTTGKNNDHNNSQTDGCNIPIFRRKLSPAPEGYPSRRSRLAWRGSQGSPRSSGGSWPPSPSPTVCSAFGLILI